jgi:serine/threonine-protein kinase
MSQLQLSDGAIFAARYQVVRRIALGGMGAVYEVEHTETLRRLALKVMLPHIVQSAEMRDRFRREAQVAAHIESEHIVSVFDAGIDDATGMPFMVMELLRGEELAQALRRVGRFGPAAVTTFLHQTALALEKTHRANIVHRDLKPENLFLTTTEDGRPRIKVLDFGIAKLVAEGSTQDPSTRSLGTPLYMAPEQFRSGQPISAATDLYALGMIAYTLLVGSSYWAEEAKNSSNVFAFAGAVMAGPTEPASLRARRHAATLPPAFDAWFSRMTAPNPADRFTGPLAAVGAMAEALGVAPASAFSTTGGSLGLAAPPPSGPAPQASQTIAIPLGTADLSPAAADLEGLATMVYAGTGPGLGSTGGADATGAHAASRPPDNPSPGAATTGNGFSTAGSIALHATTQRGAGSRVSTSRVVAAVLMGAVLGVAGLLVLFFAKSGGAVADAPKQAASSSAARSPSVAQTPAPATADPAASQAAPATPPAIPSAAPSASAVAAVVPSTPASALAAPATARPTVGPRKVGPAPEAPKKSIFVRD